VERRRQRQMCIRDRFIHINANYGGCECLTNCKYYSRWVNNDL
jgi:hypothetical protein